MNVTKNQVDDLNATIKIELAKEDYAERVKKALGDYQKKVVVKGFRTGKTPMGMVKKMYGRAVLAEEINKVLGEALNKYIKENELQLLGEPLPNETEQKEQNLEADRLEFFYDIALSPEANVKMSKREKVPYYVIKADDEMIDKQIESLCKSNGSMVPVEVIEGTEYLKGELFELDEDGRAKEEGVKNEEASLAVSYIKDEEAIGAFKGKKVGEEVKFNAAKAFPNKTDYAAMLGVSKEKAERAGENYGFVIREIKRYVDAEVNEELFAKVYGKEAVRDVADFRAHVKRDVEKQLKEHSEYRFTIDAKEKIVKKNEGMTLPEAFLKRWIVAVNEKMTPEEAEKDFEGFRDEFKWQVVKSAVLKEYGVKVEEEDLRREGRRVAAAQLQQYGLYGLSDEQLDGFAVKLQEDEKQRRHLYERALDNKVFEVIRENMKLEEQEVSMADFEKLFQK